MSARGFAFGDYVVDPLRRLAWVDGQLAPLTGKAFDILVYLVEHRDRVVEKDDLLKALWPDTFVQENSLVRHISTLRRALGQRADQHDCILTVQGRGYRFVAEVTELETLPPGLPMLPASAPVTLLGSAAEVPAPQVEAANDRAEASSFVRLVLPPASVRPRMNRAFAATIGIAAVAVIATAVLLVAGRRGQPASPAPVRMLREVTYGPSTSLGPAWSPDGKAIAYASDRSGTFRIWVQHLDGSEPVEATTSPGQSWQPSWSPDGQWLAFRAEGDGGGILEVSLNGGMVRRVSDFGYRPRWSPDGSRILFSSSLVSHRPRPHFFIVSAEGGAPPQEVRADLTGVAPAVLAAWAPDGEVAIWSIEPSGASRLVAAPIEGRASTTFTISDEVAREMRDLDLQPTSFTWSPDGQWVVFDGVTQGEASLWRVGIDFGHAVIHGPLERLTTAAGVDRDAAVSPDGTRLAYSSVSESTHIWSFPLGATGQIAGAGVPVTLGGAGEYDAAVSADGRKLIYRTTRDGRQELWERSIDEGKERRLITGDDGVRSSPRWSPDGSRLAYQLNVRQPHPGVELAVFAFNDMREQVLTDPGAPSLIPDDWSRDGSLILGPCVNMGSPRLGACVASAVGPSQVRAVATDSARDFRSLRFSPDERWISAVAITHGSAGRDGSAIVVMPFTSGALIPLTDGVSYDQKPVWGADSRTVYFVSNRNGFFNIWGRHFDPMSGAPAGEPFRVTDLATPRQMIAPDLQRLEIAVAARHLYVPVTEASSQVFILQNLTSR